MSDAEVQALREMAATGQYKMREICVFFVISYADANKLIKGLLCPRAPGPVFPDGLSQAKRVANTARRLETQAIPESVVAKPPRWRSRKGEKPKKRTPEENAARAERRRVKLLRHPYVRAVLASTAAVIEAEKASAGEAVEAEKIAIEEVAEHK